VTNNAASDSEKIMVIGNAMNRNAQLTRITIVVFIMTFSISLLWSFLQPLYGSPDETAHVVKAVATASGQLQGQKSTGDFGFSSETYDVPTAYAQGIQYLGCILGPSHADASCVGPFATGRNLTSVTSTAAHYPPLYYLLVGPAGLAFPGSLGMYLMRIVSSMLSALMLTFAFRTAFRFGGSLRSVGVIAACTPMVFSLSGAVNPHGLEISSSILFWVTLLTGLEQFRSNGVKSFDRALTVQLLLASVFFALVRPAGFVWMSISTLLIVSYVGIRQTMKLITVNHSSQKLLWSVPFALLLSVAFYLWSGVGTSLGGSAATEKGSERLLDNLWTSFDRGDDYFRYMFGWFGWVEFSAPPMAFFLCIGCLALALTYAVQNGNGRESRSALMALVFTIFLPILLEGFKAASSGFGYQGRYTLAIAVGIPILGFWRRSETLSLQAERRLMSMVLIVAMLPTFMCIDFALKRYSVGESGPRFWFLDPNWLPPGGMPLICALMIVIFSSFIMLIVYLRQSLFDENPNRNEAQIQLA
jgi:hypothetical protein